MEKILKVINGIFSSPIQGVLDKIFPDKNEKLKFEMQLREIIFKEMELEFKDLENARQMQIEALRQNDLFSKRFVYYLSLGVLLNSFFAGAMAFFVTFPSENKELVMMYYSFSFIIAGSQIMQFFFGRSKHEN
ncbi:hypothetical protein [Flavobacterium filum]|uniref:hypothetical protein n=1 Tax=Flavobacterium filum TaxID=370974 RepID=UPI000420C32C|nr:hypothetical protein [Flavobacterium filum]